MNAASKRYAKAFLEIGIERGNYKTLQGQLRELADVYEQSAEFRAIVANPGVSVDERRAVIRAIAQKQGWDVMTTNLTLLLVDKDRIKDIADIANQLDKQVDLHDGNVRATVTTATSLDAAQVESIKAALVSMTGKKVILKTEVDAALIGGATTRIGDMVLDGSLRTQLSSLRQSILEEV
ncbi:MAG: ATP synthase F1 subunit delta [bacterium]